jgi:hypothetical protein
MSFRVDLDWEFDAPHWVDLTQAFQPDTDLWFEAEHESHFPELKLSEPIHLIARSQSRIAKKHVTDLSHSNGIRLRPRLALKRDSNKNALEAVPAKSSPERPPVKKSRDCLSRNSTLEFFLRFQLTTRW